MNESNRAKNWLDLGSTVDRPVLSTSVPSFVTDG